MDNTCIGCYWSQTEDWPHERTAYTCCDPAKSVTGSRRVVLLTPKSSGQKPVPPAWCRGRKE